jgi:hypothetical protein
VGTVYSRTGSGLLLAEEGADAASISRALRQMDPELILQPDFSQSLQQTVWKVYRYQGDRPPVFVMAFVNERGDPYPLSSRILDMVRGLDKNSRWETPDPDVLNAAAEVERQKVRDRIYEDLADDVATVGGRGHAGMLPRSQSLRMARDKARARGLKI